MSRSQTTLLLLLVAAALGISRIWLGLTIPPEPASWMGVYKAIAHLFMGGLAVAAWQDDETTWMWPLFWVLCILEVAVAIFSRI